MGINLDNTLMALCLDFGLGIIYFNGIWLGLGLTGLWFPALWWFGALFFSIFLIGKIFNLREHKFGFLWKVPLPGFLDFILILLAVFYLLFILFQCLLPETFYDSLNYFLGMPCYWLFHHGISDYPTQILSGYFHGGSLFFMNGYVFGGTEGAKILNAFVLVLCALCACAWVRENSPGGNTWGIFAVSLTFPLLYLNGWAVRVDGLISFIILLFFYFLFLAKKNPAEKTPAFSLILVTALLAGLAISVKPSAVTAIAAGFIAWIWVAKPKILWKRGFWLSWVFSICFLIGPWFLKNYVYTGNPFYPYAIHLLGNRAYPESGYHRLWVENTQYLPMNHGLWSILSLPWRLTMPQAGDGQFIGPLLLAFCPLLLLVKFKEPIHQKLARATAAYFLLGLCLSHMLRFILPAFLTAFILLSAALGVPEKRNWRRLWLFAVFLSALLSLPAFIHLSAVYYDPAGVLSGRETAEEYLNRKLLNSYEPMAGWIGGNLPQDARLLLVGDSRGVYYPRDFLANSAFDEPFFQEAARTGNGPRDILKSLRRLGITHVALNIPEGMRIAESYGQYLLNPGQWGNLNEFVRTGLEPVYYKNFLAVYRVKPALSEPEGPYLVNPFSFFYPPAYDWFMKQGGNPAVAEKDADKVLSIFPRESFWWEKKAMAEMSLAKDVEADSAFRAGDSRGILTLEGYRAWAGLAGRAKDFKTRGYALRKMEWVYASSGEKR